MEQSTLGIWPLSCKINYVLSISLLKSANIKVNRQSWSTFLAQSSVLQYWHKILSIPTKATSYRNAKNVRKSSYHINTSGVFFKRMTEKLT